jgi:multidrug efflux pump subunit AcrA (membrane-fusion protein)
VEESDVKAIRVGQSAEVTIDSIGSRRNGPVAEIVPVADPATRTVTVKVDLPPEPRLRSGLYGRARFVTGARTALAMPSGALVERGQLQGAFVVDTGGVARFRLVTTGRALDGAVEILSGLGEGERVVADGVERLADGAPVTVR